MNLKLLTIIVAVLLLIVGIFFILRNTPPKTLSANQENVVTPKKKLIIAAFGDSLTAGYGVTLEESYPSILEKKLQEKGIDATVINMGVSGETTSGGRERISFVLEQNPDIILLGLGANDMLRTLPVPESKENLKFIIEGLQKGNKNIVLLGMQSTITNGLDYKRRFDAMYKDLANDYSLPLVPFFLKDVALVSKYNTGDGIHPNKDGYEVIVNDNILPVLLPYIEDMLKK